MIEGSPEFFALSRTLREAIEGFGDLNREAPTTDARELYDRTQRENAAELLVNARPGDLAVLHDVETAGLIPHLAEAGLHVIWRCHEVTESLSDISDLAWEFLAPFLPDAKAYIFPREGFIPPGVERQRVFIIPTTLD